MYENETSKNTKQEICLKCTWLNSDSKHARQPPFPGSLVHGNATFTVYGFVLARAKDQDPCKKKSPLKPSSETALCLI